MSPARRIPRLARGLAVLLALLFVAASAWRTHPHPLAFFNMAAGGPEKGFEWLADSNLDWGQDLPGLAAHLRREGIDEVVLSYFGRDDPSRYGISWRPLGGESSAQARRVDELLAPKAAVYALSVHHLIHLRHKAEQLGAPQSDWLSARVPTCTVGHSILLYDLRPSRDLPDTRRVPRCSSMGP